MNNHEKARNIFLAQCSSSKLTESVVTRLSKNEDTFEDRAAILAIASVLDRFEEDLKLVESNNNFCLNHYFITACRAEREGAQPGNAIYRLDEALFFRDRFFPSNRVENINEIREYLVQKKKENWTLLSV